MHRVVRIAARIFGVAAATLPFSSCYLLDQGASLFRYQAAAEPVDEILDAGAFADGRALTAETRSFLLEVKHIREFGASLGLAASDNYSAIVPTDRHYLADVVNATGELSFERHEWWWPFVGRLPYKGYYDPNDAQRLADRLRARGLDVWVRRVDAFSTLGILADPLYEFMTRYDRYTIANLIMHERAHATIFVRGDAQFNEELATFVGDTAAELYLRSRGADEEELFVQQRRSADRETARLLILDLRADLETLYAGDHSTEEKRHLKTKVIDQFRERINTEYEELFKTDSFRSLATLDINNAFIDLYVSYTENLELFREAYVAVGSNLSRLLETLEPLDNPRRINDRSLRRIARQDPRHYVRTVLLDNPEPGF